MATSAPASDSVCGDAPLAAEPDGDVDINALFAPYQRLSPPFDARQRVTTALFAVLLLPLRVAYLVLAGGALWLASIVAMSGMRDKSFFLYKPLPSWRKLFLRSLTPIIRSILFVTFGIYRIERRKAEYDPNLNECSDGMGKDCDDTRAGGAPARKAYVVVANHLGYIDILVLLGMFRGSFVAKGAIEKVRFVGTVAQALQCMFVREGESLTTQLISRVEKTYECHANCERECTGCGSCMNKLIIFPEGTTCNGTAMIPFRTGVFNAGLPVKPVCIKFPVKHFNLSWETIRFREHLFRTMTQWSNKVVITELPVYTPTEAETKDARVYAGNVQRQMAKVLEQPVVPLNRKHKFLYHSYLLGKVTDKKEVVSRKEKLSKEDTLLEYLADTSRADAAV